MAASTTVAMSRRTLLAGSAASGLALAVAGPAAGDRPRRGPIVEPFTLGVASGDPGPSSVVLWTRLAPDPLAPGGGMPSRPVPVLWEIAKDESFRRRVCRGVELAWPEQAHSVHATVRGLEPGRHYWYRFRVGRELSPVGRTRTASGRGQGAGALRIAMVSCQDWQDGYYTAYRHLADEDVDLVVHLGDYIYEGPARDPSDPAGPRVHDGPEIVDLTQYRNRHALYKTDPDLQAAHAGAPWVVTFDDHEVDNDWSGEIPEDPEDQPTEAFLARRAVAFQAYYEHLPLPSSARPSGPTIDIYRQLQFGELAALHVLDTRQYRSVTEPCGYGTGPACDAVFDPSRTMLGDAQETWLHDGIAQSQARWNLIAQQVPMMRIDVGAETQELKLDKWDAYPVARQRLLDFLATRPAANPVVLTGDLHDAWVGDLTLDFNDPAAPAVATEFIGTSISSDGDGAEASEDGIAAFANGRNPHIRFHHYRRGYTVLDVSDSELIATFRAVPYVSAPEAPVSTVARFAVTDGVPGAQIV